MKLLIEQNEDGGKRRNAAKKKEREATEKRIAELSAIFKLLYEDIVTGRISDERFTEPVSYTHLKNQKREDVKNHHYIISFDPRDAVDNGLTVDRAQALGEEFCARCV